MTGVVRDAVDAPEERVGNDSTSVRQVIDASLGCAPFTVRVLRAVHGRSFARHAGEAEELLFVLSGTGEVIVDDDHQRVEPETGIVVRPGQRYELENPSDAEDLVLVSVSLHDPEPGEGSAAGPAVARLADQADQAATGERLYRIVFDAASGCPSATQFVGYIPVGRLRATTTSTKR